jgi:hypothetical protein
MIIVILQKMEEERVVVDFVRTKDREAKNGTRANRYTIQTRLILKELQERGSFDLGLFRVDDDSFLMTVWGQHTILERERDM